MTRYPRRSYGRHRNKKKNNKIYIISIFLIIGVLLLLIFNPFKSNEEEIINEAEPSVNETVVVAPAQIEQPEPEPVVEPNLPEVIVEAEIHSNPEIDKLILEAMEYVDSNPPRIIKAREILNDLLPLRMSQKQREFVKSQLSDLANEWLFSKTIHPDDNLCGCHKVEPGDMLSVIGKKFKVPYEILLQINGLKDSKSLQAGQTIKVINGPFHARICRSTFTMDVFLQNTFVRSFKVGLGKPGHETPIGLWLVEPGGKMEKPAWTDTDTGKRYEAENPDYPLGSRWIGLKGIKGDAVGREGFAIHGTKNPNEIGTATSRGCIRLHNGNVILVYNLLIPGFSQVEVVD